MSVVDNIDFKKIATLALQVHQLILSEICPGGKMVGREWVAGSVNGGEGRSFSFNTESGKWSDFSTGDKGGDLISLYAKALEMPMLLAAKEIDKKYLGGVADKIQNYPSVTVKNVQIIKPPSNANPPPIDPSSQRWCYRDKKGEPLFYVVRGINHKDKSKFYYPQTFNSDGKWDKKHFPNPPLYNLHKIMNPAFLKKWICVVEGEKAADAAQQILGDSYIVTTWPAGVNNFKKADWSPLKGRKILFWPDADDPDKVTQRKPGIEAMNKICSMIAASALEMKFIDTNLSDKSGGWDAADALAEGMDMDKFKAWAKPLAHAMARDKNLIEYAPKAELLEPEKKSTEIKVVVEIPGPEDMKVIPHFQTFYGKAGIRMDEKGNFVANAATLSKIIAHGLKGIVWRDEFYNANLTKWNVPVGQPARLWTDDDTIALTITLQDKMGVDKASKNNVEDAINFTACLDRRNEPREWIDGLNWDGIERIENFFHAAMNAEDNEWSRVVSKNFWISMVARIFSPGCQVDEMVVLESPQGTRKTSMLRAIAGPWYGDVNADLKSVNFDLALRGKMIVEFGELSQMKKTEIEHVKFKITCMVDQYRAPYGRTVQKYPRTCIFAGTTNEEEYLKDHTGARRFNPIKVGHSDMNYIHANREQLFAEAAAKFKAGWTWWEYPQEIADVEREKRRETDEWEFLISAFMESKTGVNITIQDIYTLAIGGTNEKMNRTEQLRISKIMVSLGYEKKRMRVGERHIYGFEKKIKTLTKLEWDQQKKQQEDSK